MIEGKDVELEKIEEKTMKAVEKVNEDVKGTKKRKRPATAPRLVQQMRKAVPEGHEPSQQGSHLIHGGTQNLCEETEEKVGQLHPYLQMMVDVN